MAETSRWHFGPFHLDGGAERLWRGPEAVRLTAKAFAVLRHLVEHAGQLVAKGALFAAVWATPYASDAALGSAVAIPAPVAVPFQGCSSGARPSGLRSSSAGRKPGRVFVR